MTSTDCLIFLPPLPFAKILKSANFVHFTQLFLDPFIFPCGHRRRIPPCTIYQSLLRLKRGHINAARIFPRAPPSVYFHTFAILVVHREKIAPAERQRRRPHPDPTASPVRTTLSLGSGARRRRWRSDDAHATAGVQISVAKVARAPFLIHATYVAIFVRVRTFLFYAWPCSLVRSVA